MTDVRPNPETGATPRPVQPELLAPAGGMEQLIAAIRFGADAAYGGLTRFGLRAAAENFTPETLARGVAFAHRQGKRFYVTLNLLPADRDMAGFLQTACEAADAGVDAAIVSDLGAALMLREELPALPLHVSTQANVLNARTALHWHQAIRKTADILTRNFRNTKIRKFGRSTYDRAACTFKITYHMAKSKRMRLSDMIIHPQRSIPVLVFRFTILIRLFSPATPFVKLTTPVVSP